MMNLLFQLILLASRLPLRFLYGISDVLFVLMFHVVGYRKKVVRENIKNSFPNKNEDEIKQIKKEFYRDFCDYIVETAKAFTISSDELRVRVQHIHQKVFHDAKKDKKNVIMLAGHIFNWEWFNALATVIPQEHTFAVYRKMQNRFWEEKIRGVRGKYGNTAIEANDVLRHIFKNKDDGNSVYMFVADQTPHVNNVDYGVEFLHQKTPVFIGYDKLATRMDLDFVFCEMKKVKRGYYQVNYYKIEPDGERFEEFEVVKKFHKLLENTVQKHPANYLWSHRKWKYSGSIKHMI